MSGWQLEPILGSYWVIAALASVLLVLLFVVQPFKDLARRRRAILTGLRAVLIGAVILAMLRPTLVRTESRNQRSTLVWMLDQSRSMLIPDARANQTRWEALLAAVADAEPELTGLGDQFDVQFYTFDEAAHLIEPKETGIGLPASPEGKQTDIGSSLYDIVRMKRGSRIAGVLLLSDGAQRALSPRVDLQQPADELARLDAPLYTIAFGQPRDRSQARDVAIESLQDQYTVFVNNEFSLSAGVRMDGFAGRKVPVQLEIVTPAGKREVRGPVEISASASGELSPVRFDYTPTVAGQYKLTIRAADQPGELVTSNNQLTAFLSVLGGGLRVLYLDGNLAWQESKFIRRSIDAAPEIQLDFQWIDTRRQSEWPLKWDSLIGGRKYDVYLLSDLDFTALGLKGCQSLAKEIEKGKGLMMMGGAHSFGPGGYYQSALREVLPIKMGQLERQSLGQDIRQDVHIAEELPMLPTEPSHFVMHLGNRQQNLQRWKALPPLLGANRFRGLKSRGVSVLAESVNKVPLLVAGQHNRGRVLAFAGDSTYRWYRRGKQAEHKRFWRQSILWLAKKEDTDAQDVWVRLDRRRYPQSSPIEFELGARNADGDTILDANFEIIVVDPAKKQTNVTASRGGEVVGTQENGNTDGEVWRGTAGPFEEPGDYTIRVTASRNGSDIGTVERQFAVQATDQELVDPAANPARLESLASVTRDAGGRSLAPEELPALIREIAENPPNATIEYQSKWQIADSPSGAWGLFLMAMGLLFVEWFLRKRWGLV